MSNATKKASIVVMYKDPEEVKRSIKELKKCGVNIKKLSIAGKGYKPCSSLFIIPGLGPIAVGGPLVGAIAKGFGGDVYFKGLIALREGLFRIGISKESLFRYETALKKGMCLVFFQGGVDEIGEVISVLASSRASEITVHYQ
jgi:hypothetical protein